MNNDQWGFVFIKENCIQCHGCETACKSWRMVSSGIKWRRVENIWHGSYPQVKCSSLSISCMHCVEPACIDVCPVTAISKDPGDGIVLVDVEKCIGCKACFDACPYDIPQFGINGTMQKCDMCFPGKPGGPGTPEDAPPCVSTCPTQALLLKKMTVAMKKETEERFLDESIFSDGRSNRSLQSGKARTVFIIIAALLAIMFAGFLIYASQYYHATGAAIQAMASADPVDVSVTDGNLVFSPQNGDIKAGFIFYPGGKVEFSAYSSLIRQISEDGYLCILVKMPFNLAVLNKSAALDIMDDHKEIKDWYIGGHSLGGVMAADYLAEHTSIFKGLVLLAAYPASDLTGYNHGVLSIYGSEDNVLDTESFKNGSKLMPENYTEICIDGGNHAYFGDYGEQEGDGIALISAGEQQIRSALEIIRFFISMQ